MFPIQFQRNPARDQALAADLFSAWSLAWLNFLVAAVCVPLRLPVVSAIWHQCNTSNDRTQRSVRHKQAAEIIPDFQRSACFVDVRQQGGVMTGSAPIIPILTSRTEVSEVEKNLFLIMVTKYGLAGCLLLYGGECWACRAYFPLALMAAWKNHLPLSSVQLV